MDTAAVLSYLQSQFPGQMVLYVSDMARVLGKSEKALVHLIARNSLPFHIKTVGGKRCIDIFQVAQWLADDGRVAQEVVEGPGPEAPTTAGAVGDKKPSRQRASGGQRTRGSPGGMTSAGTNAPQPASSNSPTPASVDLGRQGKRLLEMRHDYRDGMARWVASLATDASGSSQLFMQELLEHLFYGREQLERAWSVAFVQLWPAGCTVRAQETVQRFDAMDDACVYLLEGLARLNASEHAELVHATVHQGSKELFHCIVNQKTWVMANNEIGIELPGL